MKTHEKKGEGLGSAYRLEPSHFPSMCHQSAINLISATLPEATKQKPDIGQPRILGIRHRGFVTALYVAVGKHPLKKS